MMWHYNLEVTCVCIVIYGGDKEKKDSGTRSFCNTAPTLSSHMVLV